VNLRRLGRQGVVLLGRVESANGKRLRLAPHVLDNMRFADEWAMKARADTDRLIDLLGLDIPPAAADAPIDCEPAAMSELDLDLAGVSTVIWATGYRPAFDWIELPVFDAYGYPQQQRGVTDFPGLYFLGLPWLHVQSSSLLYGVGEDAAHLARWIADCHGEAAA
jgi:putative flavoprotein involved in K+ transport